MLLNLYKLINKHSNGRTPLEDFTTECLAGILQQSPLVLKSFIRWLNLPEGEYKVSTQVCYYCDEKSIIDLVLESSNTICFIENKVHSTENPGQLEKYLKVLDREFNKKQKQTYLKYCTKFSDLKKHRTHHFSQFRWYELAKFLEKNHSNNPLVLDYLEFLKLHQMTRDTSISTDTVITLNKFLQTYKAMEIHVENALDGFKKIFPRVHVEKQEKLSSIEKHDRIARFVRGILSDTTYHNELLYCIHFETVKLQTQIWISNSHPQVEQLYDLVKNDNSVFKHWKDDAGLGIFLDKKLYDYINDDNSDEEIRQWFEDSFKKFRTFIDMHSDMIQWNSKILR